MLRLLAFTLFVTCSFGSLHVRAADTYRRVVNFEWEPIEGAKYYDIEIRKKAKGSKTSLFKTEKAEWTGKLSVGRYEFRLRSLDTRKVPGDWSDYSELDVALEPVKPKSPADDENIKATDAEKQEVKFEWQETPGASGYTVEILNEKNEVVATEKVSKPQLEYTLPTAALYSWKVKAISEEGLESEGVPVQKFTLMGPKLEKAKIEKPENEFVREVKWKPVEKADHYDLTVAKYNPILKKWQKFKEFENVKETSLAFEADWPGGQYKIIVKSKAPGRETSDVSVSAFPVREGNRGPAAEYVQTMRKSIDRVDGWFSQASWYASSIDLKSQYRGTVQFATNAVTGTGRLGIGLLRSDSPWGFLFILDAGGFIFENKIYNFFGTEISAIKRQNTSDRAEIRYLMGIFTKEFPVIYTTSSSYIANSANPNNAEKRYSKGGVLGAHGGVEYWYSMTPKLGFQANAHLYMPLTETDIPNSGKYSGGDMNYSLGVLGSYRWSSRATGLIGVNLRDEVYSYTDNSDSAGWGSAIFQGKSTNKVKTSISGIYINLMAEYSF
jgi:hypothetical protein